MTGSDPNSPDLWTIKTRALGDLSVDICKLLHMIEAGHCSRIKGIDPIMPKFESVLPCNSSDAP